MKSNTLSTVLLGVLLISALFSVGLCYRYTRNNMETRRIRGALATINFQQMRFNSLLAETAEYSKKNPAVDPIIDPVLEALGIKQKAGATAPQAPQTPQAPKPATR
jgi:hypothetical protein